MFRQTRLSYSLGVLIGLVQLKQPGRNHNEIDSDKRREESGFRAMFEVVPERHRCNGEQCEGAPRSQPHAARISLDSATPRGVQDYEEWRIDAGSPVEDFESHARYALDLLLALSLRFREAIEQ